MKVTVPKSLDDITLRTFVAIETAKTDLDKVAALTGIKRNLVEQFSYNVVTEILDIYTEISTKVSSKHYPTFNLDGTRFGFIPDLDAMTFREHVDLETYASTIWLPNGDTDFKELPNLVAILFRPVSGIMGEYYDIAKYDTDKVKHYLPKLMGITMSQVYGALVFFSTIESELILNTVDSITQEMQTMAS